MEAIRNYSGNGYQGSNYSHSLSTKEIAKIIRENLKKTNCKFSVTFESFAGGSSINVALMEAPFEAFVKDVETKGYEQLNQYYLEKEKKLTPEAKEVMLKAYNISKSFNYDDSDSMIDYFDTNFYLHLEIGKWDKPFKKVVKS
jgi:hypothetical protein